MGLEGLRPRLSRFGSRHFLQEAQEKEDLEVRRDPVYPDPTRVELVRARGIEGPRRWTSIDIEILLPSTTNIDPSAKHRLHRPFEVPYCRIVSLPARTVEVYGIAEGAYQLLQASGLGGRRGGAATLPRARPRPRVALTLNAPGP